MAITYKEMAIKQKEILRKLKEEDFSNEELSILKDIEDVIDKKILDTFNGGEVYIDLSVARFNWHPIKKKSIQMNNIRRDKMYRELLSRYNKAGWSTREHIDDGLEGNLSGGDYLILKGKQK